MKRKFAALLMALLFTAGTCLPYSEVMAEETAGVETGVEMQEVVETEETEAKNLFETNENGQTVVHAGTTSELIAALKSDTEIILEGKDYVVEPYNENPEAAYVYMISYIEMNDINNVTIRGQAGTRIISNSGSDVVFRLYNCKNIRFESLTIGHDIPQKPSIGGCDENVGVIDATDSNLTLEDCDIFGCGWFGVMMRGGNLTMNHSKIRDCSSYILDLMPYSGDDNSYVFTDCDFYNNGYSTPYPAAVKCGTAYIANVYHNDSDTWSISWMMMPWKPQKLLFKDCRFRDCPNEAFCGVASVDYSYVDSKYRGYDAEAGRYTDAYEVRTIEPDLDNVSFVNCGWIKDTTTEKKQDQEQNQTDEQSGTKDLSAHWEEIDGKYYWYEDGIRQGTKDDPKGVRWSEDAADAAPRGREIYDPVSDAWYWLDAVYDGAKAAGKEVFMPYVYQDEAGWSDDEIRQNAAASDNGMQDLVYETIKNHTGKWVRYNEYGAMMKGWVSIRGSLAELYPDQAGNIYYYDEKTGLMAKGWITLDGRRHHFDEVTGALIR